MKTISKLLWVLLAGSVITAAIALLTDKHLHASPSTSTNTSTNNPVPVIVTNTASSPVSGRDVDNPARSAFTATCELLTSGGFGNCTLTTVPAGSVLVIETMTANLATPSGTAFDHVTLAVVDATGHEFDFYFTPKLLGTTGNPAEDYYQANDAVHVYAAEGHQVVAAVNSNSASSSASGNFTISGYVLSK